MRLIDAEALKAKWYDINDIDETDRGARFVGYTEIARLIDQAPTVSADAYTEQQIRDAYNCGYSCGKEQTKESLSAPSGDLISRVDAIEAVRLESAKRGSLGRGDILNVLSALPSADAVQGEWIMHIYDLFPEESTQECSNCHEHETIKIRNDNFCPNCGAKMNKGGDTE